jgi:hypothetical protein
MSGSCKWSVSLRFPHQNFLYAFPLPHMEQCRILKENETCFVLTVRHRPHVHSLSRWNLFPHNNIFPLISVATVVPLGLHTSSPAMAPSFGAFKKCLGLKLSNWTLQLAGIMVMSHNLARREVVELSFCFNPEIHVFQLTDRRRNLAATLCTIEVVFQNTLTCSEWNS